MLRVKSIFVIALLVCLTALPVLAQDASSAAATTDTSDPIGTMTILIGVGVIILVGGVIYMREKRREVD